MSEAYDVGVPHAAREAMGDVRVRAWSGSAESPNHREYAIPAHVSVVGSVAGLVPVSGDYVYDEYKHGRILSMLLHGRAHVSSGPTSVRLVSSNE